MQDSPLSSKVAMFNKSVNEHQNAQLLNPFAQNGRGASPRPKFSKEEYGKWVFESERRIAVHSKMKSN